MSFPWEPESDRWWFGQAEMFQHPHVTVHFAQYDMTVFCTVCCTVRLCVQYFDSWDHLTSILTSSSREDQHRHLRRLSNQMRTHRLEIEAHAAEMWGGVFERLLHQPRPAAPQREFDVLA